jgi:hypothetical protein
MKQVRRDLERPPFFAAKLYINDSEPNLAYALERCQQEHAAVRPLTPKPEIRHPKPETRAPGSETRDPKSDTRHPRPGTRNPKPERLLNLSVGADGGRGLVPSPQQRRLPGRLFFFFITFTPRNE